MGKQHSYELALSCITFGAPRTGNHTFVKEFEACMPECWNIINGKLPWPCNVPYQLQTCTSFRRLSVQKQEAWMLRKIRSTE